VRPEVACSRRCGTVAPDAETALALGWEHLPPNYWICPLCDAREAAATEELLTSLKANSPTA
jgi:hypothetical protein